MNNDRYKIISTLGKGGWGEVSLAIDKSNNEKVAIKRIVPDDRISADSVRSEIEALSGLDHPGVVKYVDSFEEDGSVHVVMEYVEGRTLEQIVEGDRLPLSGVKRYAQQIIEALDYIHSRGIIHSDLKPENIIIDKEENIRLIDFGIVRTASAEIASDIKEVRGTLHYMSPEQAEGNPYDIRSDLFSMGVVLYELCCGTKPFTGDYDMAVIYSILYEEPVAPDRISDDINPELSHVIMQLLSKNPSERPASAAQLLELLPEDFGGGKEAVADDIHRTAVLPFEYPSGDGDSRLIAEGLYDELNARLSQLKRIETASPIKVKQHLEHLSDGSAIRNHLGVDDYLTGKVRRMGSRLRIYIMLVATADDSVIWSDKLDGDITDLFDVIDNITEQVTEKVKAQLSGETDTAKTMASTTNPEAYELYLLAKGYYIKFTERDFNYARKMFKEALKLDPRYALAQVGIADCYCAEYMNYVDRRDEAISQATEWAEKALSLVPNLPEAYRTLGRVMQTTGRVHEAANYFLKAVTYKEDYYQSYRSLGWLSKDCFKYDEALKWVRKSLSINSSDLETIFLKGLIHFERKESKAAINDFTRCLELRPDYGRAYSFRGMTYFQLGRVDDAIASLQQAINIGGDINAPYLLGYYHLCQGAYKMGINALLDATRKPEISFLAWFYLGIARILLNQPDETEECLNKARDLSKCLMDEVPDLCAAIAVYASSLALLGETENSRKKMKEILPFVEYDGSAAHDIARIYAILGDLDNSRIYRKMAVETFQGPTKIEIDLDPILIHFDKCNG